ncbi:adenylate/guanylate cyclase domain-containing protein [Lutimaribacter marinistellae]|uniref:Adenylate/guanylate cyclase domain-containing protein n=1 Tax=Lutimaribacter marinistellae TaxID=1820329 RepID=A0ABV7TIG1_9RHOB
MERRLAAIFAADVVGYSRMMAEDEAGTFERLGDLRRTIMTPTIEGRNGRIVKLLGDGLLAEFASVVDAVEAAIEVQAAIGKRNTTTQPERQIELRIGVNMGDLIIDGDDIFGDGVNKAARLEPLARPGGICISREVFEYTRGKVSRTFEPAGIHQLKNIPEPIAVFRLADASGEPTESPRSNKGITGIVALVAIMACIAVALFLVRDDIALLIDRSDADAGIAEITQPTLLVLPFKNRGLPPQESYLADGLTDDLITDFSKISGLMVVGSNTAFAYKDSEIESNEIGRELGVRYVLDGSVRKAGERVFVNARLTDTTTGQTLWAERLERDASDVFAIEDDIITWTLNQLEVVLTLSEQQRIGRLPTSNLEAYDYFLRAEEAARSGFRPGLREALALYSKATSIDPEFARAFAAQARTEALIMQRNYDDVLAYPVARKRAYEHASRALEIDPEAGLPFAILGELQAVDRRYEEALRSAQFAVENAPGDAAALLSLSFVHTFAGRHEEAVRQFEKALRLNPLLPSYSRHTASLSYILSGNPARAVEILEDIRDSSQGVEDYFNILGAAYIEADQPEKAKEAIDASENYAPHVSAELYGVLFAHFRRPEDLDYIIEAMIRAGLQRWPFDFQPGTRKALSGDELAGLITGEVWRGNFEGRGAGLVQISQGGTMALRSPMMFATGSAYVHDNELCLQRPGVALGRAECGPIYGKSEGSSNDAFPYTYVNGHIVFHFAPGG